MKKIEILIHIPIPIKILLAKILRNSLKLGSRPDILLYSSLNSYIHNYKILKIKGGDNE